MQAAAELVMQGRCIVSVPSSCAQAALPGVVWKPLVEPVARYPWSVLWRVADQSDYVEAVRACTRALSLQQSWL